MFCCRVNIALILVKTTKKTFAKILTPSPSAFKENEILSKPSNSKSGAAQSYIF